MTTPFLFKYTQSVLDVTQLHAYLSSQLPGSFEYVNYAPATTQVTVAAALGTYSDKNAVEAAVITAMANYSNPPPTETLSRMYVPSSGIVTIASAQNATSLDTGALQVSGGIAAGKDLFLAGNLNVPDGAAFFNLTTVSANYTIGSTDLLVGCDTTAKSAFSVTLPASSGNTHRLCQISKISYDTVPVTILPSGTDTIAGMPNLVLNQPFSVLTVACLPNQWYIVSFSPGYGSPTLYAPSGMGVDGSIVVASNQTLTRNMYYNNLTVNTGVSINANGWRITVSGLLTLNGVIHMDGGNASGMTAGTQNITALMSFLGNGGDGAAGRNNNGNGNLAPASTYYNAGGQGGAGGTASTFLGGNGGALTTISPVDGGPNVIGALPVLYTGRIVSIVSAGPGTSSSGWFQGGSGGGSGGCQVTPGHGVTTNSGGGGGGGGVCIVVAQTITGNGSVQANGGNGGNAAVTGGTAVNPVGGGGGGGGGYAVLLYQTALQSNIVVSAAGGTGGQGVLTGANGQNGDPGNAFMLPVN